MNIIYSCIIDDYDVLRDIKLEEGWRAICFSNTDIVSSAWEIVKIEKSDKIYREIKLMPKKFLPDHDKSVWIDGNLEFHGSLNEFVKDKSGFWLMTHPDRNCLYEEAKRCMELEKDDATIISHQIYKYLVRGYPHNNGLSATGVIVRDNTNENTNFGIEWWKEVSLHSKRDQLSFNYIAHVEKLNFKTFPFLKGFTYHYHVHRQIEIDRRRALKKRKKGRMTTEYIRRYGAHDKI